MSIRNLDAVFAPSTIAVIGASNRRGLSHRRPRDGFGHLRGVLVRVHSEVSFPITRRRAANRNGGSIERPIGFIGSFTLLAIAGPGFGQGMIGDAERGGQVAERWCSTCHLVSESQERANTDAATFRGIAERSPEAIDALAAFLMDPHPPMPDLSLTRQEIRDILAFITSLR